MSKAGEGQSVSRWGRRWSLKIVDCLVEFAPDTNSSRGIDLLLRLISEASLKVSVTDA